MASCLNMFSKSFHLRSYPLYLSSQIICDTIIWKLLLKLIKPLWKAPSLKAMVIYIYLKDHSSYFLSGSYINIIIFNILFLYHLTIFCKINIAQVATHIYLENPYLSWEPISILRASCLWVIFQDLMCKRCGSLHISSHQALTGKWGILYNT